MFQKIFSCLILLLTWSLSEQSVVGIYDSGIRFESRKYPGWFIGFDVELIKKNVLSYLHLFPDSIVTNKTLWYIEKKVDCDTEHGYYIRSLSFPNYYINVYGTKFVLTENPFCFKLIYNDSYTLGDWFEIKFSSSLSVGFKKGGKDLIVASNTVNQIETESEVWALKYSGKC